MRVLHTSLVMVSLDAIFLHVASSIVILMNFNLGLLCYQTLQNHLLCGAALLLDTTKPVILCKVFRMWYTMSQLKRIFQVLECHALYL